MTNLTELAEKVEGLEKPDREVDCTIVDLFGTVGANGVPYCAGILGIADFTSSTDAVLSLISEKLPGWGYRLVNDPEQGILGLVWRPGFEKIGGLAQTPATALLSAFLHAFASQDKGSE